MADNNLLTHVTQTQSLNCASACLAMLTGRDIDDVTDEFDEAYRTKHTMTVGSYLKQHNIPHERLDAEPDAVKPDTIYLAITPSLNLEGSFHYVVIEMDISGDRWWIYDPNEGRHGRKYYTGKTLTSYLIQYAIPREWVRNGRTTTMNKILQQDECAPDSLQFFECDFLKITGSSLTKFKENADRIDSDGGECTEWVNGIYTLRISGDHPFYVLYSTARGASS